MNIIYNVTNNRCYNDSDGSINITSISFTPTESVDFASYEIVWYGGISNTQLSNNNKIAVDLPNGIYSFRLVSLSSSEISDLYTINITSPPALVIDNIYHSEYSCGSNGSIEIYISGGSAPYSYRVGPLVNITNSAFSSFTNLEAGTYSISIEDSNGCLVQAENIELLDSNIEFNLTQISTPISPDSYADLEFNITGNGPFELSFISQTTQEITKINSFETSHIKNILDNTFYYYINDKIYPDTYTLTIKDRSGCSISADMEVTNTAEIFVDINASSNTNSDLFTINSTLPIFDTLLIPYKLIFNNSEQWNHIKKHNLKNYLSIIINDQTYKFLITRTMLNKYCTDSNKIEILKLGNTSKDWFFYLQLAPAISLATNPEFINAKIELDIDGAKFPITLGLNNNQQLDSENLSLIRGSFIIAGIIDNQFSDSDKCYITTNNEITNSENYDFLVKNITVSNHRNLYSNSIVTIINFLDNFNLLIDTVTLNQNFCELSIDDYQYLLNIKHLLLTLNNFNYNDSIYVYSVSEYGNGSLMVNVKGQDYFYLINETVINTYNIEYFYFTEDSTKLSNLLLNNELLSNIFSVYNMKNGFYILRIKDKYNNKPKYITNNRTTIEYNDHYTSAKQYIQLYNPNILDLFLYGDILAYIPKKNNDNILNTLDNIPTINLNIFINNQSPTSNNTNIIKTISQTNDTTNTSSLTIKISPTLTKCVITGPNNYQLDISQDTKLINMIPGVYIIQGNEQDLFDKNLFSNYVRVLVDKNSEIITSIKFNSYKDKVLIKE